MDDEDSFELDADGELTEFNVEESEFLPHAKKAVESKKQGTKGRPKF